MLPPPYASQPEPNPHHPPHPSRAHRPSRQTPLPIRLLRIVAWFSPTITIFASFYFDLPSLWLILGVLATVLVAAGCFDAILLRTIPRPAGKPPLIAMLGHFLCYIAAQFIVTPILIILTVVIEILLQAVFRY